MFSKCCGGEVTLDFDSTSLFLICYLITTFLRVFVEPQRQRRFIRVILPPLTNKMNVVVTFTLELCLFAVMFLYCLIE